MKGLTLLTLPFLVLGFAACAEQTTGPDEPAFNHEVGRTGAVAPTEHSGNFVSFDDQQLCYDIFAAAELSGFDLGGFKLDPPSGGSFLSGNLVLTLTSGKYLKWETYGGVSMFAVVVKGGPNYHIYNYLDETLSMDEWLHSPLHKGKVVAISHLNFCFVDGGTGEGCTPGYWRNHADRWLGVAPGDDFDTTFGVELFDPNITLGAAIWLGGGGHNALARHATAALLNSYGGVPNGDGTTVDYPYTTAEVIAMLQAAVADGTIEATKDLFAAANELGCPLSGTRSVTVE